MTNENDPMDQSLAETVSSVVSAYEMLLIQMADKHGDVVNKDLTPAEKRALLALAPQIVIANRLGLVAAAIRKKQNTE